jgi:autonomous glycyl radical cofactor GrcA
MHDPNDHHVHNQGTTQTLWYLNDEKDESRCMKRKKQFEGEHTSFDWLVT